MGRRLMGRIKRSKMTVYVKPPNKDFLLHKDFTFNKRVMSLVTEALIQMQDVVVDTEGASKRELLVVFSCIHFIISGIIGAPHGSIYFSIGDQIEEIIPPVSEFNFCLN